TYSSNLLPGGATLDPTTGVFEWTPAFFQAGTFDIPFSVSDGQNTTTLTTRFTVLNVNAPPVFDDLGRWEVQENQQLRFRAFAFDPDNPSFVPPDRLGDGTLSLLDGTKPSVTLAVSNMPVGGSFDAQTGVFTWIPGFNDAGQYTVTFIATDDGNG